jgi:sporulation protein YlmC with PRC-barrel domain
MGYRKEAATEKRPCDENGRGKEKKMKKLTLIVAMVFACLFIIPASHGGAWSSKSEHGSTALGYKSSESAALEYRASQIMGGFVQNKEGNYLGTIRDLIIDPQNGGVAFAVLSQGGSIGIPMKFVAVPFGALTPTEKKRNYLLDVSWEKIATAPSFNRSEWPQVADRRWETDIYRYYGLTPPWGETHQSMAESGAKLNTYRQIVGTSIRNPEGEKLGVIRELVADSQGHVPFAIVAHGGYWGIGAKLVAVPFRVLSFDQKASHFVFNSTKEKLESAPAFKDSDLGNREWAEEVYRFFGQYPYWTE